MNPTPNIIEILVTGKNLTKPAFDEVRAEARTIGEGVGSDFSKGVEDRVVKDAPAWGAVVGETAGERAGFDFTQAMGGRVRQDLPGTVEKPLEDSGRKGGAAAGKAAAGGISPLIAGAFATAATVGPAVLLAGAATAAVGIAALLAKSNTQIAADYQTLGQQVSATMSGAVSQITPQIDAGVKTLEAGVTTLGPQLDQLFASVGPDASQLASGLVQLAQGALPGIVSGMNAVAPVMHDVAADFGKIGQGVGGLFAGLGGGVGGATTAFNALAQALSELLPDVGKIIGYLSNGLGPALSDIVPVVDGAAKAITVLTGALSPGEIQAAGVAFATLFGSFKLAGMVGALEEGATFTSFLKGTPVVASEAEGALKGLATKGVGALSAALDVATGPLGLIIAGAGLLGNELGKLSGVGDHTAANVDALTSAMSDAANGSAQAQGKIDELANAMQFMANTGGATDGIKSIDTALTQLFQSNPQQAASEFTMLSKSLEANGESADDVAKEFPHYTKAVADAQLQSHLLGSQTDQLTAGLIAQASTAKTSANASAQTTLAALGATDGTSKLVNQLYNSLTAYSAASTGAGAYGSALQALNGVTQTLDDAQNSLAQQMLNAKTSFAQNKYSMDLSTQAGIDNREALSAASKSIIAMGVAQYQTNGNMTQANKLIQDQINAYVKSTGATGKAKDAITTYLEQITKIPPDVTTTVHVQTNIDYAVHQVNSLMNWINSQTGFVSIGTGTGHGFGAKATGGVVGAASGMVRGGLTLVNEHGIESATLPGGDLVTLPMGSTVHSNPDTQRMLSEAASGRGVAGGALEVNFAGNLDGAFATAFMQLIRHGKIQIKQKAIVP